MRARIVAVAVALALTGGTATATALVGFPMPPAHGGSAAAGTGGPAAPTRTGSAPGASTGPVGVGSAAGSLAPVDLATLASPADRSRPLALPAVAPLSVLRTPDVLVTLHGSLTDRQLSALHEIRGLRGLTAVDIGTVRLAAGDHASAVRIAGVNPSEFREFTPRETAVSDPLWQRVAVGELASSYGLARARHLPLGGAVTVQGHQPVPSRIGAVAVFAVPGVDVVTSTATARALGVVPASAVLLAAPDRGIDALQADVRGALGNIATLTVLRAVPVSAHRPATYRDLYIQSARYCPGLPWQVLAAIGQVESGHGRDVGPSSAGALGPMQFLPSTWAYAGVDGDGDGTANILDPYDAVPAAALYLCRAGAGNGTQGLYDAIFSYNHADWYVREVLALAAQYR